MEEDNRSVSNDRLNLELSRLELRMLDKLARKEALDRMAYFAWNIDEDEMRENTLLRTHEFPVLVKRVDTIQSTLATPEKVARMVDLALETSQKKGWTRKERVMQVMLVVISVVSVMVTLLNFAIR
jgi:hypothetical protein